MIICDICTGRHLTSTCVIASALISATLAAGTPDDYVAPTPPLMFPLPPMDELAARRLAIKREQDLRSTRNRDIKRARRTLSLVS